MGRPNKYPDQFRKDALELVRTEPPWELWRLSTFERG